jgi:hypothetical protein
MPEDEKKQKNKEKDENKDDEENKEPEMIEFKKFFTYMTKKDRILMWCGTISSLIAGILLPCISLAMGAITNTYDTRNNPNAILD